jgi:hypothetical protein
MKTLKIMGQVDDEGRLHAEVPPGVAPGSVQLLLLIPDDEDDEDDFSDVWMRGIAREWSAELADPREDVYTLGDGEEIDGHR